MVCVHVHVLYDRGCQEECKQRVASFACTVYLALTSLVQYSLEMSVPAGGVTLQVDSDGRETGEAYVEFVKPEDAEKALYKDRQMIGHRYTCVTEFHSTVVLGWSQKLL